MKNLCEPVAVREEPVSNLVTEKSGRPRRAVTLEPEDLPGSWYESHGELAVVHIWGLNPLICAVAFAFEGRFYFAYFLWPAMRTRHSLPDMNNYTPYVGNLLKVKSRRYCLRLFIISGGGFSSENEKPLKHWLLG